jgi:arylsulfatase A-like enzyme
VTPLRPNIVLVFADQLRYQALGYAGDPNAITPRLDALADLSVNFTLAISGCPVCCPARASLLTGQYPHQHGVVANDVCLGDQVISLAEACRAAGYDTAYIGKWHLDGHGRSNYTPPERRHGFDYWKALECTHDYNHSVYYAGDDPARRVWDGYDAIAQTRDAQAYLRQRDGSRPFLLMVSWGPPHNPYETAPEAYRRMYEPGQLILRPNVPPAAAAQARLDLAGYYAHTSALDEQVGALLDTLRAEGLEERTLFMFWSDHGDMLGSHGQQRKQRPWDESIRVPLLLRCPAALGEAGWRADARINTPDLMPTLLGLCGIPVPATVSGLNYAPYLRREAPPPADAALLACYQPFGEYTRRHHGGREYRGLRTARYTYVRDLSGPWLLYDNAEDPYQLSNRVGVMTYAEVEAALDWQLDDRLRSLGDAFLPGMDYMRRWSYPVDETGTVPYED